MTTAATVEIQGSATGFDEVVAQLSSIHDALAKTKEGGGQAAEGADFASEALGKLKEVASGLGLALGATELIKVGWELENVGASANRLTNSLDTITSGKAPEYIEAMRAATHNLIGDEQAARASSELLSLGLAHTSGEAAHLAQVAVTLGEAFGNKGAAQSIDDFTMMLTTGRTRGLWQYGIAVDEVKKKAEELKEADASLSDQEATSQAIMAVAEGKAAALSGTLDDQKASIDKLTMAWEELKDTIGRGEADAFDPFMRALNNVQEPSSEFEQNVAGINKSIFQFIDSAAGAVIPGTQLVRLFVDGRNAAIGYNEAIDKQKDAQSNDRDLHLQVASALREQTSATREHVDSAADLQKAIEDDTKALDDYYQQLEKQSALQLRIEEGIKNLTGVIGNQGKAFEYSVGQMSQMNLSASRMQQIYNELGLATGQVTEKQIKQATEMRELDNLLAKGAVDTKTYLQQQQDLAKGLDVTGDAAARLGKHFEDIGTHMHRSGDIADKWAMQQIKGAQAAEQGTTMSMQQAQQKIDDANSAMEKLQKLIGDPNAINLDPEKVKIATGIVNGLQDVVNKLVSQTYTLHVNIETSGSMPVVPSGATP